VGQPVDQAAMERAIGIYCAAWNETDPARRDQMLAQVWADDATYMDPTVHLVGRQALVAHIDTVLARYPGSTLEMTSALDVHHTVARFAWKKVLADGTALPEGIDFAEVGHDGKLIRIVGFFGPLAPAAAQGR
jgi:hypothetical protein